MECLSTLCLKYNCHFSQSLLKKSYICMLDCVSEIQIKLYMNTVILMIFKFLIKRWMSLVLRAFDWWTIKLDADIIQHSCSDLCIIRKNDKQSKNTIFKLIHLRNLIMKKADSNINYTNLIIVQNQFFQSLKIVKLHNLKMISFICSILKGKEICWTKMFSVNCMNELKHVELKML